MAGHIDENEVPGRAELGNVVGPGARLADASKLFVMTPCRPFLFPDHSTVILPCQPPIATAG